jgi:hypothetical protein
MKEPRRKRTGYLSAKQENSFNFLTRAAERRGIRPSIGIKIQKNTKFNSSLVDQKITPRGLYPHQDCQGHIFITQALEQQFHSSAWVFNICGQ